MVGGRRVVGHVKESQTIRPQSYGSASGRLLVASPSGRPASSGTESSAASQIQTATCRISQVVSRWYSH